MPVRRIKTALYGPKGETISLNVVEEGEVNEKGGVISGDEAVDHELDKIRRLNMDRRAGFYYHAYMNGLHAWTLGGVMTIFTYARENDFKVRLWENVQSGARLIVVRDTDMSEDSGYALYERMNGPPKLFESMGLAHWIEWETYGIEVDVNVDPKYSPNPNVSGVIIFQAPNGDYVLMN